MIERAHSMKPINDAEIYVVELGKTTAKLNAHKFNNTDELWFWMGENWREFYKEQPEEYRAAYMRGVRRAALEIFPETPAF